jgi:hypothetical protein
VSPGGAPGEGGPRTTAGPGGSRSGGGSGSGSGTLSGDGAPPDAGSPTETADPTFAPFTESGYEAEAGLPAVKLLGSAEVAAMTGASGGQVVRNLGKWSTGQPGSVQLRVNFPVTGTYRVALSYVAEAVAGQATLVVSGTGPYPVVFPVGSGCCPVVTVEVTIVAGARSLTVSNSTGPLPAIDRIVITAI